MFLVQQNYENNHTITFNGFNKQNAPTYMFSSDTSFISVGSCLLTPAFVGSQELYTLPFLIQTPTLLGQMTKLKV